MDKRIISVTAAAAALGIGYAIYASTKKVRSRKSLLALKIIEKTDMFMESYRLNESWSAQGGADDLARMRALLESGASVNTSDQDGRTLLFHCVMNWPLRPRGLEIVRLLLDRGAAVNQASNSGFTPLYVAAYQGRLDMLQLLLDRGAAVNQARNGGFTPLYIAAHQGHLDVVQLLLDRGAAVNQASNDGRTPLFIAVQQGHLETVRLLLDRGADVPVGAFQHRNVRGFAIPRGHAAGAELVAASQEASALALQGDEEPFRGQIRAAELCAPWAQWVPVLPAAARVKLVIWAKASVRDSAACYTVLFEELPAPTLPEGGLQLSGPRDWDVEAWRNRVGHNGVVGIRRLIVSFLVHPKPGTRRLLRELVAMGDFSAEAGVVEAVPGGVVEAAARRAAAVRTVWFKAEAQRAREAEAETAAAAAAAAAAAPAASAANGL